MDEYYGARYIERMERPAVCFESVVKKAATGDTNAQEILVESYGQLLLKVVRKRLRLPVRRSLESQDLTQEVWAQIFRDSTVLAELSGEQHFINYCVQLATRLVIDEIRKRFSAKRNVNREVALEDVESDQPPASTIAMAHEILDQLLEYEAPRTREILRMRLIGYSFREIGLSLGCSDRTVRRVIARLSERYTGIGNAPQPYNDPHSDHEQESERTG